MTVQPGLCWTWSEPKLLVLSCTGSFSFSFQTQSDYSETSSVSESRHLFADDSSDNKGQSTVPMTSFNFINSIIGSGIIGKLNPYLTNGFSHHYHLGEYTFILGASGRIFANFIPFFDEIPISKQKSPRWDTAFCVVTSGAILFGYVQ